MLQQWIVSFVASAAFGVLFSVPRRLLLACGLTGMLGWGAYMALLNYEVKSIPAALLASFLATVVSQVLARLYKSPVTTFSVSGIVPLVPGGLAYDAMRHFVQNDYVTALQLAAKVCMISGAIAMGLVLSEVLFQILKRQHGAF